MRKTNKITREKLYLFYKVSELIKMNEKSTKDFTKDFSFIFCLGGITFVCIITIDLINTSGHVTL